MASPWKSPNIEESEAIALYRKNGYAIIPNYGPYLNVENSVCFEKKLPIGNGMAARIAHCTEPHKAEILGILNHAILHTTALYEYQPRKLESMDAWFEAKRKAHHPVVGASCSIGMSDAKKYRNTNSSDRRWIFRASESETAATSADLLFSLPRHRLAAPFAVFPSLS